MIRSKSFRRSRFHVLVFSLSVSDFLIGMSFALRIISQLLLMPTFCIVSEWMIYCCSVMSLSHTLMVCLERLNATFVVHKTWIKNFTSNKMMCTVVIICVFGGLLCSIPLVLRDKQKKSGKCSFIDMPFPYLLDIPLVSLLISITISYTWVIKRMHYHMRAVVPREENGPTQRLEYKGKPKVDFLLEKGSTNKPKKIASNLYNDKIHCSETTVELNSNLSIAVNRINEKQEVNNMQNVKLIYLVPKDSTAKNTDNKHKNGLDKNQPEQFTTSVNEHSSNDVTLTCKRQNLPEKPKQTNREIARSKRFKTNVLTLGVIIIVTFLSIAPKCVFSVLRSVFPDNAILPKVNLVKSLFLLNTFVDPFIYILRIKEFRDKLKPRCS